MRILETSSLNCLHDYVSTKKVKTDHCLWEKQLGNKVHQVELENNIYEACKTKKRKTL